MRGQILRQTTQAARDCILQDGHSVVLLRPFMIIRYQCMMLLKNFNLFSEPSLLQTCFDCRVTLYAEFLPSKARATCVTLVEMFWAIGACFEVLLALFVMPTLGWSYLLGFSAIPLLIFSIFCVVSLSLLMCCVFQLTTDAHIKINPKYMNTLEYITGKHCKKNNHHR